MNILWTTTFCICVKRVTLCNWLCSSSHGSASLIRYIGECGAKSYFTDHQTANTIQLFISIKREFFWSILFQNKSQQRGISKRLLDKYSHLFIWISSKQSLSNSKKNFLRCQNLDIRISSLCSRALLWPRFSFLKVNQQKRAGMVSTNNMQVTFWRYLQFLVIETISH